MTMTINRLDRIPGSADALIRATTFDTADLVPVIAQDARTGGVRMFAWANREALRRTVETGLAHFWSRSRQAIWRKGETSGNVLRVRDIRLDCDGDVILYVTDAEGPSCHTGHTSCFFRGLGAARSDAGGEGSDGGDGSVPTLLAEDDGPADPPAVVIARVASVIARRRRERPEKSYVVSLLDAGWPKILGKIIEESGELVDALPDGDVGHTAHEAADLIFHMLVGLDAAGVPVDDVFAQLRRRFGVSGLDEKASRPKADGAPPGPMSTSVSVPAAPATVASTKRKGDGRADGKSKAPRSMPKPKTIARGPQAKARRKAPAPAPSRARPAAKGKTAPKQASRRR